MCQLGLDTTQSLLGRIQDNFNIRSPTDEGSAGILAATQFSSRIDKFRMLLMLGLDNMTILPKDDKCPPAIQGKI